MDWNNVEEMPHRHDEPVTTSDQLNLVIDYCFNNFTSTSSNFAYNSKYFSGFK